MKNGYKSDFWLEKIAFYFDGVGFAYKRNPKSQAVAPKGRVWRRSDEGTHQYCTARGKKTGTGGNTVKFFAAISYNKGFISYMPYEKLNGDFFAAFVKDNFPSIFEASGKTTNLFLQDGDPSQNSAAARNEIEKQNFKIMSIPSRSPDINPIENIFHLVRRKLDREAIEKDITNESKQQFTTRIINIFREFPQSIIDRTIESMPKRIHNIIKAEGQRIKY